MQEKTIEDVSGCGELAAQGGQDGALTPSSSLQHHNPVAKKDLPGANDAPIYNQAKADSRSPGDHPISTTTPERQRPAENPAAEHDLQRTV